MLLILLVYLSLQVVVERPDMFPSIGVMMARVHSLIATRDTLKVTHTGLTHS